MTRKEDQILEYDCVVKPSLKYYVYFIYLPHKVNPVYVGKGSGGRYKTYARKNRDNGHNNRILVKKLDKLDDLGEKYSIRIVFESDNEDEALDVEEFYISYFGRLYNNTGILYNFETGGMTGMKENPRVCRPVYVDGFVFPSLIMACEKLDIYTRRFYELVENNFATHLDSEEFQNLKNYEDTSETSLNVGVTHGNSKPVKIGDNIYKSTTEAAIVWGFSNGSSLLHHLDSNSIHYDVLVERKKVGGHRRVYVWNLVFESIKEATEEMGFNKPRQLWRYLENSNIPYYVDDPDASMIQSSKPKPITINGVTYENRTVAAKEFGYKHPKSFSRHLRNNPDKYIVNFH